MKRKYLIVAPSYNENNGGCIVQHKLCSILNDLGYESYLYPPSTRYYELNTSVFDLSIKSVFGIFRRIVLQLYKEYKEYKEYKINPAFNSPLFTGKNTYFDDDWVVVYPEITFGNPLKAKNVVRWLLHQPGFHTGKIFYEKNELLVKFNSAISGFYFSGSHTSSNELKVIYYPLEYYNLENIPETRSGTAYCLRKGIDKPIQHDLDNSILIDGKSHIEIATIFKQVKTFISYDTLTAYSLFAVLCGCDSIVIPDDGVTEAQWYPNPKDRYGLSYGFDGVEKARKTAHLVKEYVSEEENKSIGNTSNFILDCDDFFEYEK